MSGWGVPLGTTGCVLRPDLDGPDDRWPEVRAAEVLSSAEPAARGIFCGGEAFGGPRRVERAVSLSAVAE